MPISLAMLTQLVTFDISYNNSISGFIPKEVGNLKSLLKLYLGANAFIGPIPTHISFNQSHLFECAK